MSEKSQSPLADASIIELYNARDERAISETDRKYGSYCTAVSMNILHSYPDAEECVNDTWLKTWHSIPPARPSLLSVFLGRIVRCISIDRFRKMHRQKRNVALTLMLDELTVCSPAEESPLLAETIQRFVVQLPTADRRLFVGRYWYGYTVTKLAGAYGMTPNAVSQRLYRIREQLRVYLTERGYEI